MSNFTGNMLGYIFVVGFILLIIMLVCREFLCWYFKINQNVALLTDIRELLATKGNSQITTPVSEQATPLPKKETPLRCQGCGAVADAGSAFCEKCGEKL